MSKSKFSNEEIILAHQKLIKGMPKYKLNQEYNVHPNYFSRAFKRLGLVIPRGSSQTQTFGDYFDYLNSEDKCYLLGILITDGWIRHSGPNYKHQSLLALEVEETDKELINYFLSKVKPKSTPMQIKCNAYGKRKNGTVPIHYRGQVYSDYLVENLINNYNFSTRKSTNTNLTLPLSKIPDEFKFSFLRGLIDGDGTVAIYGRSRNEINYYIGFVSTSKKVVIQLINFLNASSPFELHIKYEEQYHKRYLTRYYLKITKRKSILWLAEKLTNQMTFTLDRKLDRLKELSKITLKHYHRHDKKTLDYANTVLSRKVMFSTSVESSN